MKKRKHKLFIVFYSIWIVLFLLLINSANKRYDECIDALFAKNACDELFGKSIDDLKILLISPKIYIEKTSYYLDSRKSSKWDCVGFEIFWRTNCKSARTSAQSDLKYLL
jgi:hypothetical protein